MHFQLSRLLLLTIIVIVVVRRQGVSGLRIIASRGEAIDSSTQSVPREEHQSSGAIAQDLLSLLPVSQHIHAAQSTQDCVHSCRLIRIAIFLFITVCGH